MFDMNEHDHLNEAGVTISWKVGAIEGNTKRRGLGASG